MKKNLKDKIKAKAKAVKDKVKGKLKGSKCKNCKPALALLFAVVLCGCMETQPASRATTASYGDIVVKIADGASSNTVTITLGDGALASADSAGSTETQTATPTMDIKPDLDIKYNDAIAGATAASKTVLGSIGEGLEAVLKLMQSKESGTVAVTKTDGTAATVKCENGQCEFCADCMPQ